MAALGGELSLKALINEIHSKSFFNFGIPADLERICSLVRLHTTLEPCVTGYRGGFSVKIYRNPISPMRPA